MSSQEAVQCLKLADSYIDEVRGAITQIEGNESGSYQLLKTLDLAMKQIDKAEQIDPSTMFNGANMSFFRAEVLAHRGFIENLGLGKRSKAISTLQKSIEMCDDIAPAHYALGAIYADSGRREEGVRHLRKAVELQPENMDYRKTLDRLESASGAALKLGAFRGSWKVMLVLAGIFILGLLIVGESVQGGVVLMLSSLAIGFIYWMLKSR